MVGNDFIRSDHLITVLDLILEFLHDVHDRLKISLKPYKKIIHLFLSKLLLPKHSYSHFPQEVPSTPTQSYSFLTPVSISTNVCYAPSSKVLFFSVDSLILTLHLSLLPFIQQRNLAF